MSLIVTEPSLHGVHPITHQCWWPPSLEHTAPSVFTDGVGSGVGIGADCTPPTVLSASAPVAIRTTLSPGPFCLQCMRRLLRRQRGGHHLVRRRISYGGSATMIGDRCRPVEAPERRDRGREDRRFGLYWAVERDRSANGAVLPHHLGRAHYTGKGHSRRREFIRPWSSIQGLRVTRSQRVWVSHGRGRKGRGRSSYVIRKSLHRLLLSNIDYFKGEKLIRRAYTSLISIKNIVILYFQSVIASRKKAMNFLSVPLTYVRIRTYVS